MESPAILMFVFVVLLAGPSVFAQTLDATLVTTEAEVLDRLRTTPAAQYSDTALAALAAAGRIDLATQSAEEVRTLLEARFGQVNDSPLTTGDLAYVVVEAFYIPAGVMYMVAPSPRYALRALRFNDILPPELEAQEIVDGRTVLSVLARTQGWVEQRSGVDRSSL